MPSRTSSGPWYGDERRLLRFEWSARYAIPGLRRRIVTAGGTRALAYAVALSVPHYPPRQIEIRFRLGLDRVPVVTVDGPESRHRMEDGSLCLWYPWDPRAMRWEVDDGLLQLICIVTEHLFKEAWWRETEEWLGDEAPHGSREDVA